MQKLLLAISTCLLLSAGSFALSAQAEEKKAEAPKEMILAKKKDHSKDKKVDATKSPSKSSKAETVKK